MVSFITMFLCFFALTSSITANIYDQLKEIGIMRALGLKKSRIIALFCYETLIMVGTSSFLGALIGIIVGTLMSI